MGSTNTRLKIVNHSKSDITNTSVYQTDSFDWASNMEGPDFKGVSIPSGQSVDRRAQVSSTASYSPFDMRLYFSDGSVDVFRINQKHALGSPADFQHKEGSHDIFYHVERSATPPLLVITIKPSPEELKNIEAEERNQKSTINSIKNNKREAEGKLQQEMKVQKLKQQGEEALRQKQYETAIEKFDQALKLADQEAIIILIRKNKTEAQRKLRVKLEVQRLNQQGEEALRHDDYEAAVVKFDQALKLADEIDTIKLITNNKTEAQRKLRLKKDVEELNQLGEAALRRKQYEIAIDNFNRALQLMPGNSISKSNKRDACYQYGKSLVQEAQSLEADRSRDHLEKILSKLTEAKSLLEQAEALRHTTDQKHHLDLVDAKITKYQNARTFNNTGEEYLRRGQYQSAIDNFGEALKLLPENVLFKSNKSDACNQFANFLLKEVENLEADTTQDNSRNILINLTKANELLAQAESLRHTSEQEETLKLLILKIDGYRIFIEAIDLEEEGLKLFKNLKISCNYDEARDKNLEAANKYGKAKYKLEKGLKPDESVRIVTSRISSVLKTISDIDKADVHCQLDN